MKQCLAVAAVVAAVLAGGRTQAGVKEIEIKNTSGKTILVTVTAREVDLVESAEGVKAEREYEAHLKVENESSAEVKGVKAGQKNSVEAGTRVRTNDERNTSAKYNWSPFIKAGEERIVNGRSGRFAVDDAKGIYYVSIRFDGGGYICINAQKSMTSQAVLSVDMNGFVVPPQGRMVMFDSAILLSAGGRHLQDPVTSKGWPAGNMGSAPGVHVIDKAVDASNPGTKIVRSGDTVRIRTTRTPSGSSGYDRMYCSDAGWVYYDQPTENTKQRWVLLKVTGKSSSDDDVIRDGDTVRVRNLYFDTSYLYVSGDWAACTKGTNDEWKISLKK